MMLLEGDQIVLRALEPEDLDFLYALENDTDIWEISGTLTPYSRKVLKDYIVSAHRDIYEVKQLRLAVATPEGKCVGLVDLFDFDPRNRRAGVGIVIAEPQSRNKGYGSEALRLICEYGFQVLDLHQIYAGVGAGNAPSLHLFEKMGFIRTGVRQDWLRTAGGFEDEVIFQKISKDDVH